MRNGIIASWSLSEKDNNTAIDFTVQACITTHWHPLCVLACVIHTMLIRNAVLNNLSGVNWDTVRDIITKDWYTWKTQKTASSSKDASAAWLHNVEQMLPYEEEMLLQHLLGFEEEFDPFQVELENLYQQSKSVVYTLKIALWSLYWSFKKDSNEVSAFKPVFFPSYVFQKRGFESLCMVPLCGQDSNSYGSVAGALLAAFHPHIPQPLLDKLSVHSHIQNVNL